jgi:hypothetical protein
MVNKRTKIGLILSFSVLILAFNTSAVQGWIKYEDGEGHVNIAGVIINHAYDWAVGNQRNYGFYCYRYEFIDSHSQYNVPGIWKLPGFSTDLTTVTFTFSGNGFSTRTVNMVVDGYLISSNIPSWMTVYWTTSGDPLGFVMGATISVNQQVGVGHAIMTVYVVGNYYFEFFGIPIGPFPFSFTNEAECWAYLGNLVP